MGKILALRICIGKGSNYFTISKKVENSKAIYHVPISQLW